MFKYHMMLREVMCSNRQSTVILDMGGGGLAKLSYNFYMAQWLKKA